MESEDKLAKWLAMIAREASDREMLPGWSHPGVSRERVASVWKAGVAADDDAAALREWVYAEMEG